LVVLLVASVFVVSNGSNALSIGRSPGAHPASPAPTAVAPFYPNVKITDGSSPFAWQVEPTMVINETGTIFVGWKETTGSDTAGVRVGASYSTDQGLSWAPNILMNQSHPSNLQCQNSDPWMALAPDQRVQYAYLEFNCNDGTNGLDVSNTTNGQDWGTVHYKLGGGGLTDKDSITVAPSGRIYAAWDEANFMIASWSDDGGSTWAPFHNPDDIPGGVLGAVVKTSANGTVYLTWWDFGSNNIFFDWSADGNTWHADKRVNDVLGSAPGQGSWQLAIPAMAIDPVTGAIYIAWPDSRNGDQDIFMSSSTDGGITWSANHRVNDDSGSHSQWMVDIAVDYASVVHAAWEDNRNGAWNIFYSNSTDGGSTWATNLRVSTQDTPLSYDRPGDYFAIEAGLDNTVYVVWTDGRGSDFDIYYARSPGFPTSTVTVTTDPVGLPVTVDGVTSKAPVATAWIVGSSHTVSVASPISLGATARYVWSNWSDGGAISHSIVVGTADATVTASFTKQYQSQVSLIPTGLGLIVLIDSMPYTATASFWWDDGSVHQVEAPTNQTVSTDVRYVWFSWSDGGSAVHSVTATAALVLTATFTEEEAMRVSTTPSGTTFAVDNTTYSSATTFWFSRDTYHVVSIVTPQTGVPGTRYQFQGWSDGGAATHVVHFTGAVSLVANFSAEYYLNVSSPVSGAGGSGWYPAGATVTATVSNQYYAQGPGERLAFQGWSGNATGTHLTSDPILMDGPKTAVAQYGTQFYLDVSSAYGTVLGADWYDQGTTAHAIVASREVEVTPGTRELFVGWSGDAAGTDVTSNGIAMDRSKIATAVWRTQYSLTIQAGPGTAATAGWYDAGATAVASLASGIVPGATGTRSVFVSWNGDASGTDPAGSRPIPMNGPRTVGTTWRTEYELRITSAYGSVVGAGWYQAGSSATASVNASVIGTAAGERVVFAGWTGDAAGDAAYSSSPILMSGPRTANAQWSKEYFLQVDSDIGTVDGSGWYREGASVQLHASTEATSAGQTYRFSGWSGGVTSADASVTVTMTGPMTVRAKWTTETVLGGLSGTVLGLILLVLGIALVIGLLVASRRRRKE